MKAYDSYHLSALLQAGVSSGRHCESPSLDQFTRSIVGHSVATADGAGMSGPEDPYPAGVYALPLPYEAGLMTQQLPYEASRIFCALHSLSFRERFDQVCSYIIPNLGFMPTFKYNLVVCLQMTKVAQSIASQMLASIYSTSAMLATNKFSH